jgi:hypothetical protein
MKKSFIVFLLLSILPFALFAGTIGKIKGRVTDQTTGEILIGANVFVVGTSFGAATDITGEYDITNLEAGIYEVRASFVGYQTKTISNVRVNADLTVEINFELPSDDISVEEIRVVATRPLVNKNSTNANRITTGEDIQALPVRGINNILSLTPGVTFQDNTVFVRGGRQDEVGFYLEGASISDPVVGGRAVTIVQDAVEEIQVQSGGYTAEYGGANAGIIYTQIKSGTPDWKASAEYITDNITFKNGGRNDGKKRLGTHWYGYSEFVGTISGPIVDPRFRLFGLINYNYQHDQNPQPYPGFNLGRIGDPTTHDTLDFTYPAGALYKNSLETITGTGTLTLDFNPIILRLVGTYTETESFSPWFSRNAGNIANFLNRDRHAQIDTKNGAVSLKTTHILNPTTFYEISGGYSFNTQNIFDPLLKDNWMGYGDSSANAAVGVNWDRSPGPYERPERFNILGFTFNAPGDVIAPYAKFKREKFNFTAALSTELNKEHTVKVGGELQLFTIRNFSFNNENAISMAGILNQANALPGQSNYGEQTAELIRRQGINNFGYDFFGNETNEDGLIAPKKPVFFAAYIQDKIEWNDLVVNIGFRYDYIDIDNQEFVDPARPELTIDKNTGAIDPNGLKDVPSFNAISPRVGVSFAVTDQTVFHAQYGKFVQQTRLRDAYTGIYSTARSLRGGLFIGAPVGFNIRPTRTTQYEIGFTQQIADFASFDITGYYKDIQDQVVLKQQNVDGNSPFGAYNILTNGDFATTKGLELSFNMRRVDRFQANATLSIQDAQGTGSFPNSNRGLVGAPLDGVTIFEPQYISPLEYNNALSGSINLDYRFGVDDGPKVLEQFGASILMTFSSGHPFTRGKGGDDLEGNARDRQPLESLNSSTTPSIFQVDLRVDKTISIWEKLKANIYVHVINLFDARNIYNVFLRTGSVEDDGFLSDPDLGGQLVNTLGDEYRQLYQAINLDYYEQWQNATTGAAYTTTPYFYGPPRQIRLGVRLEY